MAEKGSSDNLSKGGGRRPSKASASPQKASRTTISSGKGSSGSAPKMSSENMSSGKRGNRRTFGIIIAVLVVLALCCLCTLAVLWFTGDSIVEFLNIQF